MMKSRKMVCAGRFYPCGQQCSLELEEMFAKTQNKTAIGDIKGGIVPHAGWVFSGQVAADVFEAVAQSHPDTETFVLFGASHSYLVENPVVYENGSWETPLGNVRIDSELACAVKNNVAGVASDEFLHAGEHSIEVNVPFIKFRFPNAAIVPIIMPPCDSIIETAENIGRFLASVTGKKMVCIGSSDLTHYGQDYGFTPAGSGAKGCKWAKDVNDKSLINSILAMDYNPAYQKALDDCSACGPASIAATIIAAKHLGAAKAHLLSHTHSSEVMSEKFGRESGSSVGYAGIVFTS